MDFVGAVAGPSLNAAGQVIAQTFVPQTVQTSGNPDLDTEYAAALALLNAPAPRPSPALRWLVGVGAFAVVFVGGCALLRKYGG